jgi:hypothetical protein
LCPRSTIYLSSEGQLEELAMKIDNLPAWDFSRISAEDFHSNHLNTIPENTLPIHLLQQATD